MGNKLMLTLGLGLGLFLNKVRVKLAFKTQQDWLKMDFLTRWTCICVKKISKSKGLSVYKGMSGHRTCPKARFLVRGTFFSLSQAEGYAPLYNTTL